MNETRFGPEKNKEREKDRERGVQHGTAVVTMANAAWCVTSALQQS